MAVSTRNRVGKSFLPSHVSGRVRVEKNMPSTNDSEVFPVFSGFPSKINWWKIHRDSSSRQTRSHQLSRKYSSTLRWLPNRWYTSRNSWFTENSANAISVDRCNQRNFSLLRFSFAANKSFNNKSFGATFRSRKRNLSSSTKCKSRASFKWVFLAR